MLKPGDIAIVSGARTPFGRYSGKLKDFTGLRWEQEDDVTIVTLERTNDAAIRAATA